MTTGIRVRMDIRHCYLPGLPGIGVDPSATIADSPASSRNCSPFVLIAKHLCGVATDLAIRSLTPFRKSDNTSGNVVNNGAVSSAARGVAIATCCHHCCNLTDYVGAEWFKKIGFEVSEEEFKVLVKWSGWNSIPATGGRQKKESFVASDGISGTELDNENEDGEDNDHAVPKDGAEDSTQSGSMSSIKPGDISRQEMAAVGWQVKRLLDQGRVQFLLDMGLAARQVQYSEFNVSPECVMIVASNPDPI
jgi:tRNA:m4X modification enzyme